MGQMMQHSNPTYLVMHQPGFAPPPSMNVISKGSEAKVENYFRGLKDVCPPNLPKFHDVHISIHTALDNIQGVSIKVKPL